MVTVLDGGGEEQVTATDDAHCTLPTTSRAYVASYTVYDPRDKRSGQSVGGVWWAFGSSSISPRQLLYLSHGRRRERGVSPLNVIRKISKKSSR